MTKGCNCMSLSNCNKTNRRRKTFATIAFVVLTTLAPPFASFDVTNRYHDCANGSCGKQINLPTARDALGTSAFGVRRASGVILASADYLDQIGQLSNMMNKFVDLLLEKVSFLAEIIIESALIEQCDVNIDCSKTNSLIDDEDDLLRQLIENKTFDRLEYENADLFRTQLIRSSAGMQDDGGANAKNGRAHCKIFNLIDLDRDDLPASEMDTCCESYTSCYRRCGSKKFDCDMRFWDCLKGLCTIKYDYTNKTLVRSQRDTASESADEFPAEPMVDIDDNEVYDNYLDDGGDDGMQSVDSLFGRMSPAVARHQRVPRLVQTDQDQSQNHRRDVKRMRDRYKACRLASKILIIGNMAFGCQSYKRAQRRACCRGDA